MANWQRKVDFSKYTEQYDKGELSVQEFAKIVAEKLKGLKKFKNPDIDERLGELVFYFEDLANDKYNDYAEEDFDYLLEKLYNWGDISLDNKFGGKKVCWIQMR